MHFHPDCLAVLLPQLQLIRRLSLPRFQGPLRGFQAVTVDGIVGEKLLPGNRRLLRGASEKMFGVGADKGQDVVRGVGVEQDAAVFDNVPVPFLANP